MRFLASKGADPMKRDDKEWTSMHYAARDGNVAMIKVLHELNGEVDSLDSLNRTPLAVATVFDRAPVVELLADLRQANLNTMFKMANSQGEQTPLNAAAARGLVDVVRVLLNLGADINITHTDNGRTPFYAAVDRGSLEVMKMLHAAGANIHTPNKNGFTPCHIAACEGDCEALELLKEWGADPNAQDNDGRTPCWWAAKMGDMGALEVLRGWGADAATADSDGVTPLQTARAESHTRVVELLADESKFGKRLSISYT